MSGIPSHTNQNKMDILIDIVSIINIWNEWHSFIILKIYIQGNIAVVVLEGLFSIFPLANTYLTANEFLSRINTSEIISGTFYYIYQ